jgi:hypothetical protein
MRYQVPVALLQETFDFLRGCGGGQRECQVLWTSRWADPHLICSVIHPRHRAHGGGFEIESEWINSFWLDLACREQGIRVQIHTHPCEAFHSTVDDAYPILHHVGFLSLVIPDFARGPVSFDRAYLAEIGADGRWREIAPEDRLEII